MGNAILVLNCGSSSVKGAVFDASHGEPVRRRGGRVEGIGTAHPCLRIDEAKQELHRPADHAAAVSLLMRHLLDGRPRAVGHRVVHGGMQFDQPTVIDGTVRAGLESLVPLAPLHEPAALQGIDAVAAVLPDVPQVACFDTAFHRGRSFASEAFALPRQFFDKGVRRYGFHGLSYEYIAREMRKLAPSVARGRVVVCHLGNGASVCAMKDGRSVDTSMGFTAADGLPMGTRTGQLDPGVMLFFLDELKLSPAQVSDLVYTQSGLLGLSGVSSDMQELLASNNPKAAEAVDYFVYRLTGYVAVMAAALQGLDGLVFTGGIGENAAPIRERVCRSLAWLGLEFDAAANTTHGPSISTAGSAVSAWVVPTDEELTIARHVARIVRL